MTGRNWHTIIGCLLTTLVMFMHGGCASPGTEPVTTLAVLPFEDTSLDKGLDYLGDGVAEEILRKLSYLVDLRVTSRTSSFALRGAGADLREAAKRLGVSTVVGGGLVVYEDSIRITVRVFDTSGKRAPWAGVFGGRFEELFGIQGEIALMIATVLGLDVGIDVQRQLLRSTTDNIDAYYKYMIGRYYWYSAGVDAIAKSVEYYQAAIDADPDYALAHASLAEIYTEMAYGGVVKPVDVYDAARAAAGRAVALDKDLSEAHASCGLVAFLLERDWTTADTEFRLSLDLNSDNAMAHYWYSSYLLVQGRFDEALLHLDAARQLSPIDPMINLSQGVFYLAKGDYAGAKKVFEGFIEENPDFVPGYLYLAQTHLALGENEEAIRRLAEGSQAGTSEALLATLGFVYGKIERTSDAFDILDELVLLSKNVYVSSWNAALIYLGVGNKEKAIEYLKAAVEERYPMVCYLNVLPIWNELRGTAGFKELLETVGLEQ